MKATLVCVLMFWGYSAIAKAESPICQVPIDVSPSALGTSLYYNNIDSVTVDIQAMLISPGAISGGGLPVPPAPGPPPNYVGISLEDFQDSIQLLTDEYAGYGISINLDSYNYLMLTESEYEKPKEFARDAITDANFITVFFDHPDSSRSGEAFEIPSTRYYISGGAIEHATTHEMGHCLGLLHTHEAVETCLDLPGQEDCETCGDRICDTPADPGLIDSYVDPDSCELTPAFYVDYDSSYQPSTTNFMSYTRDGCRSDFSYEQIQRIFYAIENGWGHLGDCTTIVSYKNTPQISSSAVFPIVADNAGDSSVVAVSVTHIDGFTDMIVSMKATALGVPTEIFLLDDGIWPDLVDDDGIYSSPEISVNVSTGTYEVEVTVLAPYWNGGNHSHATSMVDVVAEDIGINFLDGSGGTGDLTTMAGEPYSSSYFITDIVGSSREILTLTKDGGVNAAGVYSQAGAPGGIPTMVDQELDWFNGDLPRGSRGVTCSDFDNDGDEDLFFCNNDSLARLYRNTGTGFVDVKASQFSSSDITIYLDGSHVSAWGDYNQDGWTDLFVVTLDYTGNMSSIGDASLTETSKWSLFRNTGTGFERTSGILNPSLIKNAISATWNDIDNDGDLDLLVGFLDGSSTQNPRVFENQGFLKAKDDFFFSDKSSSKGIPGLSINSMDWVDLNHDQYLDLVVTGFGNTGGAFILENVLDPSGGRKFTLQDTLSATGRWEGASVGDLDLNGEEDIVLSPHSGIPAVFLAEPGSPRPTYKERGFTLGVKPNTESPSAFTSGAVMADFNNDHDLDLYLGRPNNEEFFYRTMRQDGQADTLASLGVDWVDIDLATLGNSNRSLIGTKVLVKSNATGKEWRQVVDGGSGRGGQRANQLQFGLGNLSDDLTVTVEWPSGGSVTFPSVALNDTFLITETTVPSIISGSPVFLHEPYPTGADWVFEWTTTNKGDIQKDKVEIRYEPGYSGTRNCTINTSRVLDWGDADVEMKVYPISTGWKHQIVWKEQFCSDNEVCHFQFRATSGVDGNSDVSAWKNFGYFDACMDENPIPQN
jgi:hypothetical protein